MYNGFMNVEKDEPYNPLAYVFIYFALITGLSSMAMSILGDDNGITMYQIMNDSLGFPGNFAWGFLSVVAGCGTLWFYVDRKPWIAIVSSVLGSSLWLFLTWLYVFAGYWDGILAATVPNLWFWSWFATRAGWFNRYKKSQGNPAYTSRKRHRKYFDKYRARNNTR